KLLITTTRPTDRPTSEGIISTPGRDAGAGGDNSAVNQPSSPTYLPTSSALLAAHISVVFMGNPGADKSTIINALGGDISTGFSMIEGNPSSSTTNVSLRGRGLKLTDVPGISDSCGEGAISDNLKLLQDALNSYGEARLFVVITPRNGRVTPDDFKFMKTLLNRLDKRPAAGVILTQARPNQVAKLHSNEHYSKIKDNFAQTGVNTTNL
ncbi:hypothetical protein BGW39_004464, partial [Mortierella sp. 14UC]